MDIVVQHYAPKFNGYNPQQWVSQIQAFFELIEIPEDERLEKVEFALEEGASEWYRWMRSNNLLHDWYDLLEKIKICFEPSHEFVDYRDELSKLTQQGTVAQFQAEFERVTEKVVVGVSQHQLIMLFVEGLKSNLKRDVQVAKPKTIFEAFSLAAYFEEMVKVNEIMARSKWLWVLPGPTNQTTISNASQEYVGPLPAPRPCPNKGQRKRKLSMAEMQDRRSKGLCYNCNKKFSPKHQCESLLLHD